MTNAFGSHIHWMKNPHLHLKYVQRHKLQRVREPNKFREQDSPSTKCQLFLGDMLSEWRVGYLVFSRMGHSPWRRMDYKLANGINILKGNRNIITLFLPERAWKFKSRRTRISERHSDGMFLLLPHIIIQRIKVRWTCRPWNWSALANVKYGPFSSLFWSEKSTPKFCRSIF